MRSTDCAVPMRLMGCFIVTPLIAGAASLFGAGALATGVGTAAGLGLYGAAAGAGASLLTGGKPLKGAAQGFGIGAGIGAAGPIGAALGTGAMGSAAIGGAAGGALGGAATNDKPLVGARQGAIQGGLTGALSGALGMATPGTTSAASSPLGGSPQGLIGGSAGGDLAGSAGGDGLTAGFDELTKAGTEGFGAAGSSAGGNAITSAADAFPTSIAATPEIAGTNPGGFMGGGAPPTGFFDKTAQGLGIDTSTGFGKTLSDNSNLILPGMGLAYNAMNRGGYPEAGALGAQASQLGAQGQQLQSYLFNGGLPPGAQQAIDHATKSAKAATRSHFAQMGLGGSTMEATALGDIDMRASEKAVGMATQLLESGMKESQLSSQIYDYLLKNSQAENADLTSGIANFVMASNGGFYGGLPGSERRS